LAANNSEQILIVGPSWVGDMVMAQSLFKLLRSREPEAQIDVIAPGWSEGILARMPEVRRAHTLAAGHGEFALGTRRQLGTALRAVGYDRAIVLPRSFKSALVPWFANVPVRTGFRGEWRYGLLTDVRKLDRQQYDQTVKRFVALGQLADEPLPAIPQPELNSDIQNQGRLAAELGLDTSGRAIAFMPGAAYGPAKMWPLEHFSRLAAELADAGHQVWVLGSDKEAPIGQVIADDRPEILNLCGRTSLGETVDLFALAGAAVTNDSGLMHVAAAAGTHVIALYGSSSPAFTPPLTANKNILHLNLDCSPCHKRECPLGHLNCLNKISVPDVYAALEAAFKDGNQPEGA